MLSPAGMTRLSEHIMRVTDVLCLSAATVRGLVHEWVDAEGLDARPCQRWVQQLLRGMRLGFKKPAKSLKELHSPAASTPTRSGSSSSCAGSWTSTQSAQTAS